MRLYSYLKRLMLCCIFQLTLVIGRDIFLTHRMQHFTHFDDKDISRNRNAPMVILDSRLPFSTLVQEFLNLYNLSNEACDLVVGFQRGAGMVPVRKAGSGWRPTRDEQGRLSRGDIVRAARLAGFQRASFELVDGSIQLNLSREQITPVIVGLPTYKTPYLRCALNGILNQSYSNWRLFVSDDGDDRDGDSRDIVQQVCEELGIRYEEIEDLGDLNDDPALISPKTVIYSRNSKSQVTEHKAYWNFMRLWRLFRQSSTGVVILLHHDDKYPENLIQTHVKYHLAYPDVVTVGVKRILIDEHGNPLPDGESNKNLLPEPGIVDHDHLIRFLLCSGVNLFGENMALSHKAEALHCVDDPFRAKLTPKNLHLSLDLMQVLRVIGPAIWTNESQIYYRQHATQDSKQLLTQFHLEAIWLAAACEFSNIVRGYNLSRILRRGDELLNMKDLNREQRDYVGNCIQQIQKITGDHQPKLPYSRIYVNDLCGEHATSIVLEDVALNQV